MTYIIKEFKIKYFFKLHHAYDSLTDQSKQFIDLYWLGFKSRRLKWWLVQVPLVLSTFIFFRKFFKILYPKITFLSLLALENGKNVVGYGFLIIREKNNNNLIAELGIFVKDDYQNFGIGKIIVEGLINFAKKENIKKIFLTVRTDNLRAYNLYEKFGFKNISTINNGSEWQNKKYDMFKMILNL